MSDENKMESKAPSRQPGYFKQYYRDKRGDILGKRKSRYHEDSDYREKVMAQSRAYRARMAIERDKAHANGEPVKTGGGPRRPVNVKVNGSVQRAWTIGHLSKRINRSVAFVNNMAKVGLLPETPFRSERGDRLWTDGMILTLKLAIQRRGEVSQKDESFRDEVLTGWREHHVPV